MTERLDSQSPADKEREPVRDAWAKVVSIIRRYPWHRDMDAAINEMSVALSARSAGTASIDTLDWNRLRSGDRRALNPENQPLFDRFFAQSASERTK